MTYNVLSMLTDVLGTITMDDAGLITCTATPGNEDMMKELMDDAIIVLNEPTAIGEPVEHVPCPGREDEPEPDMKLVTRESDPRTWFAWLPVQYHGVAFRVVPA